MMDQLPLEIICLVMTYLPVTDVAHMSMTSKRFWQASHVEWVWRSLARSLLGIRLPEPSADGCSSARLFFRHILYPFRHCIGLFRRVDCSYFGGLLKVVFDPHPRWRLRFLHCDACLESDAAKPLVIRDFFSLCLSDDGSRVSRQMHDELVGSHQFSIQASSREHAFQVVVHDAVDWTKEPLLLQIYFRALQAPAEVQQSRQVASRVMQKLTYTFGDRSLYSFERLHLPPHCPTTSSSSVSGFLRPGLFKAEYGSHGLEIVLLTYPSELCLEAVKITGDPNVPAGKVTFRADLNRALLYTSQEDEMDFDKLRQPDLAPVVHPAPELQHLRQMFHLPLNCHLPETGCPENRCAGRFVAQGQIAHVGFQGAQFIDCHLVLFNTDLFGVLFIDIKNFTLFHRVEERLDADCYTGIWRK